MLELLSSLFGPVGSLEYELHQLFLRTLVVYVATIAIVRLGDKRFIGEHSAFDFIVAIILGSIMSRIIIEDFTFVNGIVIATFLVIIHSVFATISYYSEWFGNLIKGKTRLLIKDGEIIKKHLRQASLSKKDLLSALRRSGSTEKIENVKRAYLERNGSVSVIKYDNQE